MAVLRLVDSGILYRNPLPGHFAYHAFLPWVVELSPQELLAAFRRGSALYASDSVIVLTRSMDGGKTWREEGLVWNPKLDDRHYSYGLPLITRLKDGSLVMVAYRSDRSDPAKLMVNPQTGGFLPAETVLFRSSDSGHSWSAPEVIQIPGNQILDIFGNVIELDDGSWFLPFDMGKAYDDPRPTEAMMVGFFSHDRGRTWGDQVAIADGRHENKGYWHGSVIKLRDGRLFTLLWAGDQATGVFLSLHRATSDKQGRNWSTPQPTGLPGQSSWVTDVGDGCMVAAYTRRDQKPPGIIAALSLDGGVTWDLENQLQLYDATGWETIGVAAVDTYPQSHDTVGYGRAHAIRTSNGEVFVTYWCTETSLTQARWARLQVVDR